MHSGCFSLGGQHACCSAAHSAACQVCSVDPAAQIVKYLESYVDYFGLRQHLVFRTEVLSVLPLAGGRHLVTTKVRSPPCTALPPAGS